jgi:phospholipase D1/2
VSAQHGRAGTVILAPNRNVWRIGQAERAAILIDGASYFGALREALIKARSTVFIIGWDLDSRTRLVGNRGKADDGYPEDFIDFLTALVNERPSLTVHLLVWDYSPPSRWVGGRRRASAFAWTTICPPARRTIRKSW